MKRKSKERNRGRVLEESNIMDFSSSGSEEELNAAKRHKVVERRKSFIAIDKSRENSLNASRSGENRPGRSRNQKRKSGNATGSSEEEADAANRLDNRPQKRFRNRLSKRLDDRRTSNGSLLSLSYGNLNQSSNSPGTSISPRDQPMDKEALNKIYSTCSALFQAHKITPQNAFSLKLVECLDEIILDFDKENLPLLARTLEIGGKIYVCRVDCAHAHTIKLATEIAANEREHPNPNDDENDNDGGDENQDQLQEARKKKRVKKKRSRFIEDNEAKINTKFEDQSSKHALRRSALKTKLHRNIEEEIDFDYLSYFLKSTDQHPLYTEEQLNALGSPGAVPDSHVNEDELKTIPWLPFNIVSGWKASLFDLWGIPLPDVDPLGLPVSQPLSVGVANDDEFAYNPDERPENYPEPEVEEDNFHQGAGDFDGPPEDFELSLDHQHNGTRADQPLSLDRLRSLDELQKFFLSLKGAHQSLQNKYGWTGPIFIKPQRQVISRNAAGKDQRKQKKKPIEINFGDVDWKENRYSPNTSSAKLMLDPKTMEKMSTTPQIVPFSMSINFLGYDEDELDFRAPFDKFDDDNNFANVTRFFINTNKTIFKLLEEEFKEGKDVINSSVLRPYHARQGEDELEDHIPDMDIEAPRDYADDSFGNQALEPEPDQPFEAGPTATADYSFGGAIFSSMFPGSLASDGDPLSKASEFDSIKFSKQPKPIDMHALKQVIKKILIERLQLTEEGKPTRDEETKMDLCALVAEMMKRVSSRMAKHMSVAIVVVGLMHVVADNKLFMVGEKRVVEYQAPWIVCRGRIFSHKDNIPMSLQSDD